MPAEFDLIQVDIDPAILAAADKRYLDQLAGIMHAHNELSVLNRLLLFSLNDTGKGHLHDAAQSVQMWCLLQLLSGKIVETWKMIWNRFLKTGQPDPAIMALNEDQKASLDWLLEYFGRTSRKANPLTMVRDKAAFHFDPLDLTEAARSATPDLTTVYLAQHPSNAMYYAGSALVFQTIFSAIADLAQDTAGLSLVERVAQGLTTTMTDANAANVHLHHVLYGIVKFMMENAGILKRESGLKRVRVHGALKPEAIGIPAFLDIGSDPTAN